MPDDDSSSTLARRPRSKNANAKVRLVTHPSAEASETGMGKTIFEHEDDAVARRYVETHHPRGREVVLQTSDGKVGHYSADLKAQGHDDGGWQEFSDEEV
jgi:hypothetical protein